MQYLSKPRGKGYSLRMVTPEVLIETEKFVDRKSIRKRNQARAEHQNPRRSYPPQGCAGPIMLREAIRNLVDNAFRHGGPKMTQVTVSWSQQDNKVAITVDDDGEGLEPHQLEKATERFVGFSASSGGGLGLSIASEIARSHGGFLELESNRKGLKSLIVMGDSRSSEI